MKLKFCAFLSWDLFSHLIEHDVSSANYVHTLDVFHNLFHSLTLYNVHISGCWCVPYACTRDDWCVQYCRYILDVCIFQVFFNFNLNTFFLFNFTFSTIYIYFRNNDFISHIIKNIHIKKLSLCHKVWFLIPI